jgi:hypothetical protein
MVVKREAGTTFHSSPRAKSSLPDFATKHGELREANGTRKVQILGGNQLYLLLRAVLR